MTNFECYKDEIKKIVDSDVSIAIRNGKIEKCTDGECDNCGFYNHPKDCEATKIRWLYEEHKETRKLTAKEYAYLSFLKEGYMVRSKGMFGEDIRVYCNKPNPGLTFADGSISWYGSELKALINANIGLFDFIKLNDEPYSIEEMLTWEHEEE